jgi:hypothetical protein
MRRGELGELHVLVQGKEAGIDVTVSWPLAIQGSTRRAGVVAARANPFMRVSSFFPGRFGERAGSPSRKGRADVRKN